jgi:hypothetical protein
MAAPTRITCTTTCYDGTGAVAAGTVIYFRLVQAPEGDTNSYGQEKITGTADDAGLLTVSLIDGAYYIARRGSGPEVTFQVVGVAGAYALPAILSRAEPL